MTPETRQIVRRYILNDFNGFIDRLVEATNITTFRQEELAKAREMNIRQISKFIKHADIELSPESIETLSEFDLPEPEEFEV